MKTILEFDNEEAAKRFCEWFNNAGEQELGFQTDCPFSYGYMRVRGSGMYDDFEEENEE